MLDFTVLNSSVKGYIPCFPRASPTHLLAMVANMSGTIYCNPPVNSNIITTRDTETSMPL